VENNFNITIAKTEKDFSEAKVLFLEYAKELNLDLCFQNFDKELKEITIQYAEPSGVLFLLRKDIVSVGCVGLRKFKHTSPENEADKFSIGEMKRLYIKKEFRGKGWSRKLAEEVLQHAKNMKYKTVRLDTLPQMKEAISLYLSLGFKEIKPYRFNPVEGTKYMELKF